MPTQILPQPLQQLGFKQVKEQNERIHYQLQNNLTDDFQQISAVYLLKQNLIKKVNELKEQLRRVQQINIFIDQHLMFNFNKLRKNSSVINQSIYQYQQQQKQKQLLKVKSLLLLNSSQLYSETDDTDSSYICSSGSSEK
ncbi:Hypothetical_protein [Hexamita inflata]|uniref:Hypothetical_protein n=1 Tax=Hexamita inflata TaxID=28002 RepID=A0AA86URK1_9EUKA|nr:Hypothetical protein HINF_LOCUS52964 [Hexamita inflata]